MRALYSAVGKKRLTIKSLAITFRELLNLRKLINIKKQHNQSYAIFYLIKIIFDKAVLDLVYHHSFGLLLDVISLKNQRR